MFIITLQWLLGVLNSIPESEWGGIILAYDNMCHLDSLIAARKDLPLDPPYDKMWNKVTKIIDSLHIKNHTDQKCLQKSHPEYNLMCAEQTFTWLSRYKKILCSMNKTHHCFFSPPSCKTKKQVAIPNCALKLEGNCCCQRSHVTVSY